MNPVEEAKRKIAHVFTVLGCDRDTKWVELVRGGYEAVTSIVGGTLHARVELDGEYSLRARKSSDGCAITILAGRFNEVSVAMCASQKTAS